MSADKAFDKWHKIYRRLDRNDARIAWEAGLSEGIRRAATASIEAQNSEPARGASIDTWQDRMRRDDYAQALSVYCRAEIADLRTALASQSASVEDASRLLKAAKVYAFNYCQDEAESEEDCVCGPKQHAEAIELFAAIAAMTKEPDTGTGKHGGEVAS